LCLIPYSFQRNVREIRRDIIECLIRVIKEYYFYAIYYVFNWVFDNQFKIITPTGMTYYL